MFGNDSPVADSPGLKAPERESSGLPTPAVTSASVKHNRVKKTLMNSSRKLLHVMLLSIFLNIHFVINCLSIYIQDLTFWGITRADCRGGMWGKMYMTKETRSIQLLKCKNYYYTSWDENLCARASLYDGVVRPRYINSLKTVVTVCSGE